MGKSAVHEHVGDKLVNLKVGGFEKVKSQCACEIHSGGLPEHLCGQKGQHVDDKQVFGDGRYSLHGIILLVGKVLKNAANLRKKLFKWLRNRGFALFFSLSHHFFLFFV